MIEFALLIKFAIYFPFGMEGEREGGIVPKYTASNEGTRFLVTTQSTLFIIPFVVFLGVAVCASYGSRAKWPTSPQAKHLSPDAPLWRSVASHMNPWELQIRSPRYCTDCLVVERCS